MDTEKCFQKDIGEKFHTPVFRGTDVKGFSLSGNTLVFLMKYESGANIGRISGNS